MPVVKTVGFTEHHCGIFYWRWSNGQELFGKRHTGKVRDLETRYHEGSNRLVAHEALDTLIESENDHGGLLCGVQAIMKDTRGVMEEMGRVIEILAGDLRYGSRNKKVDPRN